MPAAGLSGAGLFCVGMTVPDELLLVGYISDAFGLRGQMRLRAVTDRPDHIAQHVRTLYVGAGYIAYGLRDIFEHKPGVLVIQLEGITTREQAEDLRTCEVYIHEHDAAPLEEDEYYLHELYGLQVETEAGAVLGQVREVLETGSNEVLIVARTDQPDLLLPMTREVIQHLDLAGRRVVVRLLEGLG